MASVLFFCPNSKACIPVGGLAVGKWKTMETADNVWRPHSVCVVLARGEIDYVEAVVVFPLGKANFDTLCPNLCVL